jgi:hypothetical protein
MKEKRTKDGVIRITIQKFSCWPTSKNKSKRREFFLRKMKIGKIKLHQMK